MSLYRRLYRLSNRRQPLDGAVRRRTIDADVDESTPNQSNAFRVQHRFPCRHSRVS